VGVIRFEPSFAASQKIRRKIGTRPNGPRIECPKLGDSGLQPVATEVGASVGITESVSQSDVWERVGAAEPPVAEPSGAVVTQGMIVRGGVLQDVSIDRSKVVQ